VSDGVMLAFLPTDTSWCQQPLPHMTLVYAGTIADLPMSAFNDLAKDAITVARQTEHLASISTGTFRKQRHPATKEGGWR
jgi:hypothetical protein